MTRYCRGCGRAFVPARAFYHSCFSCWREAQLTQAMPADSAGRRENERLRRENERLRVLADQPHAGLDAVTIRQLLQVCHPDKNGGSALATEVTQKLLRMREGAT